jgi:predicted transcriptional regulator
MKGGKTRFQTKFPEQMFIDALTTDTIKSTVSVMEKVKCGRSTAKNMLEKLVSAGKVRKVEIEGNGYGWQKVGAI